MSGATSALVRESLQRLDVKSTVNRVWNVFWVKIRVNGSDRNHFWELRVWVRRGRLGSATCPKISNSRKPFGRCYLSGEKKFPYQILASRFSHTQKAMLFQAVMPLCLGESTLRKHISRKRVVRTGVVVISLDSEEKRKKPSSSSPHHHQIAPQNQQYQSEKRKSIFCGTKGKGWDEKSRRDKSKEKRIYENGGNIFRKS